MTAKGFVILAALELLGLAGVAPAGAEVREFPQARSHPARASDVSAQRIRPAARPRIEISPRRREFYRQCTGGYELQHRPSGTVLFPYRHCWWVRG